MTSPDVPPEITPERSAREVGAHDRLVPEPVFLLSSARSGSTLLRMMLDSHPQIRAPHEMYLPFIEVKYPKALLDRAMDATDLDRLGTTHVLWDALLDRELRRSGKQVLVEKTPINVYHVDALRECWPQARFVFLMRNPVAIFDSLVRRGLSPFSEKRLERSTLSMVRALDEAMKRIDGLTVRYEEITEDPQRELTRITSFLGLDFDPRMLEYGQTERRIEAGLGDSSDKLRSGRVQRATTIDRQLTNPELIALSEAWGYPVAR